MLTKKEAWLALAEAIYGNQALVPHASRSAYDTRWQASIGLCSCLVAMHQDGVISDLVYHSMMIDLHLALDAANAYRLRQGDGYYSTFLFPLELTWEPRVDFCLFMAGLS